MVALYSKEAFLPLSSDLDWCEPNYTTTQYVAEFYNTVSNVLFFIYVPILVHTFATYARKVSRWCHLVWFLLAMVGAGSTYFHATLSLAGQLVDEVAIVWVLVAVVALWFPRRFLPAYFKTHVNRYRMGLVLLTFLVTFLSTFVPAINNIVLMSLGVPVTLMMNHEIKRCESLRAKRLGHRFLVVWMCAVACWLSDQLMCSVWRKISFPYLHSIWHVLVACAATHICVLLAYLDTVDQRPEDLPVIKYYPYDSWEWVGVPYVTFHDKVVDESYQNGIALTV